MSPNRSRAIFVAIVLVFSGIGTIQPLEGLAVTLASDTGNSEAVAQQEDKIEKLILDLGDDDYVVRENAYLELVNVGEPALQLLQKSARTADSEVRFRIRRLIRMIEIQGYELRIKQFLASSDPEKSFGLHGWKQVASFLGTSRDSRSQFVAFQKQFPEAMKALEKTDTEIETAFMKIATTEIDAKRYSHGIRSEAVTDALVCNMILASSMNPKSSKLYSMNSRIANWLTDHQFNGMANEKDAPETLTRMISGWLSKSKTYDQMTARRMTIAINIGIQSEAWRFAKMCLADKSKTTGSFKMQAILFVRDHGDASHTNLITRHLEDQAMGTSIYQANRKTPFKVQIRDAALETLIKINNAKHEDYGMVKIDTSSYSTTQMLPNYGFEKDENRTQAIKKWKTSNKTSK